MKNFFRIVSVFLLLFLVCGCSLFTEKEKTYSLDGLKVTMGEGLKEEKNDKFTAYLEGKKYIFTSLKESFDTVKSVGLTENSPLVDYAKLVIANNGLEKNVIEKDGLTYFTYDSTIEGTKYYYMAFMYKSKDAFWLINFACLYSEKNTYETKFIKWAKTVKFE